MKRLPGIAVAVFGFAATVILGPESWAAPSAVEKAEAFQLNLPVRCQPGRNCWLVNLVDLDPGPGRRDYLCRQRTYDGHKGTDIAIRDLKAMADGVAVLAAAPGRVKGFRDGMKDIDFTTPGAPSIKKKECGNGVVLDHDNGWETQYCHLRQGSIAVRRGQRVARGQMLGWVGNSGRAQFPHVHLSVRYQGAVVDPFVGLKRDAPCGVGEIPLWRVETLAKLGRAMTAIYNAGFATGAVKASAARRGILDASELPLTAAAIVLWADVFWVEAGDQLTLVLSAPDGAVMLKQTVNIDKDQARRFVFAGKKRETRRWPPGTYRGEVTLVRDKETPKAMTFSTVRMIALQ